MRSKPFPAGLLGPVGINELDPSDSPGGFTQTYASKPGAGAATGLSPMPAPEGLHQLPLWMRLSMRVSITKVLKTVEVLGPVGRLGPPQPLREVSINMPMPAG